MIGGPFEYHIERILRDKAHSMNSPVVSACDPGIRSAVKCFGREDGMAYQTCDILVRVPDLKQVCSTPLAYYSVESYLIDMWFMFYFVRKACSLNAW